MWERSLFMSKFNVAVTRVLASPLVFLYCVDLRQKANGKIMCHKDINLKAWMGLKSKINVDDSSSRPRRRTACRSKRMIGVGIVRAELNRLVERR